MFLTSKCLCLSKHYYSSYYIHYIIGSNHAIIIHGFIEINFEKDLKHLRQFDRIIKVKLCDWIWAQQLQFWTHCAHSCRENFMEINIFYEELSYEKIVQLEAFPLLSFVSEVGGFLGLLLGASIMTLIELLDYIFIHVSNFLLSG